MLLAEILSPVNSVVAPTPPSRATLPVPAVMLRFPSPLMVLLLPLNRTSPAPAPVLMDTSPPKVVAPVTVTLPLAVVISPFRVIALPVKATPVSAIPDPISPVTLAVPVVALMVRFFAPSTAATDTPRPVSVTSCCRVMASRSVCAPVVVMAVVLTTTVPAASVLSEARAWVPPTAPLKTVSPAVLTVSARGLMLASSLSRVEPKLMFPPPELLRVVLAASSTASP